MSRVSTGLQRPLVSVTVLVVAATVFAYTLAP
jgi:hypothetical protein